MNVIFPVLIIAGISSVLTMALLIIVIASIHASERRMNFGREPRTWPEKISQRLLGVYCELPRKSASSAAGPKRAAK